MKRIAAFILTGLIAACSGGDSSNSSSSSSESGTTEITVTIAPATADVAPGAKQTFTATVKGADDKTVTWSVKEKGGGSITEDGTYTAPADTGSFTVVATSNADDTTSATATVTVAEGAVSVSVFPAAKSLLVNQSTTFTASVDGADDHGVTWSVVESGGGSVSGVGTYTAPGYAGVFHVKATSKADASKSAQATVTVSLPPSPISVAITPSSASIYMGGSIDFTADVAGASNGKVTWSVLEANGGQISANGTYTAPMVTGVFHVVATSKADTSVSNTAAVTVTASNYNVTITPSFATVETGGTFKFDGSVNGLTTGNPLSWSVSQANGGLVGGTGSYSAPYAPGTFTIVAVSKDDPTKTASATATVVAANPTVTLVANSPIRIQPSGMVKLTATVSNSTWDGWTVAMSPATTDSGWLSQNSGSASEDFTYTAPVTPGSYQIIVSTNNKPVKTAALTITVAAPAAVNCPANTRQILWSWQGASNPDGVDMGTPLADSLDAVTAATLLRYSVATTHTSFNIISEFLPRYYYYDMFAQNITQVVHYQDSGADGFMGTADDKITSLVNVWYFPPGDPNEGKLKAYAFMAPGTDGKLGTGDDVVDHGANFTWDGGGHVDMIVSYTELGVDGANVANSEITQVDKFDFGSISWDWVWNCWPNYCYWNGYLNYGHRFTSPGNDGVWDLDPAHWNGSSDDVFGGYVMRSYNDPSFRQTVGIGLRKTNYDWADIKWLYDRSGDYVYSWTYDFFFTGNGNEKIDAQSYYGWGTDYTTVGYATNWPTYVGLYSGDWYAQGHQRACP